MRRTLAQLTNLCCQRRPLLPRSCCAQLSIKLTPRCTRRRCLKPPGGPGRRKHRSCRPFVTVDRSGCPLPGIPSRSQLVRIRWSSSRFEEHVSILGSRGLGVSVTRFLNSHLERRGPYSVSRSLGNNVPILGNVLAGSTAKLCVSRTMSSDTR